MYNKNFKIKLDGFALMIQLESVLDGWVGELSTNFIQLAGA